MSCLSILSTRMLEALPDVIEDRDKPDDYAVIGQQDKQLEPLLPGLHDGV